LSSANRRLLVLLHGFLLSVLSGACIAAETHSDLYVATNGEDSNPGTIEKPLRTIQHAADMAKPGDTVYVRAGSYCQQLAVRVSGNAQQGFITFQSQPGEHAVLDGGCLTPEGESSMVLLTNVSFVRVQGFEIRNLRTSDYRSVPGGIRVFGGGSHIEILHNDVHHIEQNSTRRLRPGSGANGFGISVYGTDAKTPISDLVIDGNAVHHLKTGSSESVVVNGNVAGFRITKNSVHDNNNIGIDVIGFEHTAPDPAVDRARDGVVSENSVYSITARGNPAYGEGPDSDGIYVDGGTRILIERNIVHDVDFGIELASEHLVGSTSHIIARNNLIYLCHGPGFSIGGYDLKRGTTEDTIIVNNTLYKNDTWKTGQGEFLMQFYMRNNVFKNNIVYVGEQGRALASKSGRMDGGAPTVTLDHNVYYFPSGAKAVKWTFDQKDFSSFEEYVSASGNDRNSRFADPQFVDPDAHDFHLQPDSPARNGGNDLGARMVGDQDLDGEPRIREKKIDIGCYQTRFREAGDRRNSR
jgi:Right handed beta helix region